MSFKEKSTELIQYVLAGNREMEILPIWLLGATRTGRKKPATITTAVPDDYVKNLNGDRPQDVYLLVKIPSSVHEEFCNWSGSPNVIKKATGIFL